jgi:hypothetical protein
MTTPFKNDYALGVSVRTPKDRKSIEHGGGIEGFNTSMSYYPDSKITVIVLSNLNGPAADELGRFLGVLAHGDSVTLISERKEITLSPTVLATYVGNYQMPAGATMAITLDGDRLMGQLTGQGRNQLFAESERMFFLKVVDAQIEFVKDGTGAVTHLVLYQGGRDMRAAKK